MAQCQLLWNPGYAVVSLKRSFKEKQDRSIQKRTQDYMTYIYEQKQILIEPIKKPLASMWEMDGWNSRYIGERFSGSNMRKFLIEATFVQAKHDGIAILEIGEDV
mgnify:CR=1 FL=1